MSPFKSTYIQRILTLFSGNVLAQTIPFLFAPLITRLYSPEEIGIQGNFIALVALVGMIAAGRYELAIILPKDDKKAFNLVTLSIKITLAVSAIVLFLPLFSPFIEKYYNTTRLTPYLPLVSLGVLLFSFHNILIQWLVRKELYAKISLVKIVLALVTHIAIVYAGWLKWNEKGLIGGFLLGFFISVLYLFSVVKNQVSIAWYDKREEKRQMKQHKDFPLVNSVHAFSDILFSEFIILALLTHWFGMVTAGFYIIMIKYLKAPSRFVSSAIGQVFYREATAYKNEEKPVLPLVIKSLKMSFLVAFPMLIIILLLSKTMFGWYLGKDWVEAGVFAKIMIFPIFISFLTSPVSSLPLIFNQQRKSLFINVTGMGVGAVLFLFTIWQTKNIYWSLSVLSATHSLLLLYLLYWFYTLSKQKR